MRLKALLACYNQYIMKSVRTGFTLIELLVVIAIIGILASVVLASLNSARAKGADASIRSNINNMRAQAELYYDDNNLTYNNLCDTSAEIARAADSVNGAAGSFECEDAGNQFRISSVLSTAEYYCVDNDGFAGDTPTAPSGTQCP